MPFQCLATCRATAGNLRFWTKRRKMTPFTTVSPPCSPGSTILLGGGGDSYSINDLFLSPIAIDSTVAPPSENEKNAKGLCWNVIVTINSTKCDGCLEFRMNSVHVCCISKGLNTFFYVRATGYMSSPLSPHILRGNLVNETRKTCKKGYTPVLLEQKKVDNYSVRGEAPHAG